MLTRRVGTRNKLTFVWFRCCCSCRQTAVAPRRAARVAAADTAPGWTAAEDWLSHRWTQRCSSLTLTKPATNSTFATCKYISMNLIYLNLQFLDSPNFNLSYSSLFQVDTVPIEPSRCSSYRITCTIEPLSLKSKLIGTEWVRTIKSIGSTMVKCSPLFIYK